ncbi:hypothetical protein N7532_001454 [Penicillium argentinense]|uniref:ABM domain-containing protein n=1 Tax=Penicillium argentinense TaxID=1131581 RepID=A0A9W9G2H6_9EURO|nr:uncharacterized protein N7532_001454 [Penicillium argentinense]KAJ5110919.1 hypothetical protein N7532_001454 [Penicillium argentinense]
MSEINVTAIIYPKPDKVDEVTALITEVTKKVQENEPDTLLYYAFRVQGKDEIVIVERYKNQAAVQTHVKSGYFKEFAAKMGQVTAKPMELRAGAFLGDSRGVSRL